MQTHGTKHARADAHVLGSDARSSTSLTGLFLCYCCVRLGWILKSRCLVMGAHEVGARQR
ncbi:predicted protein [Plenodomus lingam JN3]|uniref:Predicted protein n=1 Tax=Leptosphaeria maculans (strain JN3 / isolate v23.1.3 / race Av1-4-5-6-7-8) TaxID=985895 RepID=E5AD27_LEPMJ|nr:predicted protein [Plenodomus lingam JN3]CBY02379.1 predicted protein [Plenodomus lingam JN3]